MKAAADEEDFRRKQSFIAQARRSGDMDTPRTRTIRTDAAGDAATATGAGLGGGDAMTEVNVRVGP